MPTHTLDQTSPTTWDVLLEGSALVAGTITHDGDTYVVADAQNLPRGSYPSLNQARDAFEGGPA